MFIYTQGQPCVVSVVCCVYVTQTESHSHESERMVLKLQAEVDRLQGNDQSH